MSCRTKLRSSPIVIPVLHSVALKIHQTSAGLNYGWCEYQERTIEARLAFSLVDILKGKPDLSLVAGVRRSHFVLCARLPFISNARYQAIRSPRGLDEFQVLVSPRCHWAIGEDPNHTERGCRMMLKCAMSNGRGWLF